MYVPPAREATTSTVTIAPISVLDSASFHHPPRPVPHSIGEVLTFFEKKILQSYVSRFLVAILFTYEGLF
jgi:hypothetical protein